MAGDFNLCNTKRYPSVEAFDCHFERGFIQTSDFCFLKYF